MEELVLLLRTVFLRDLRGLEVFEGVFLRSVPHILAHLDLLHRVEIEYLLTYELRSFLRGCHGHRRPLVEGIRIVVAIARHHITDVFLVQSNLSLFRQ